MYKKLALIISVFLFSNVSFGQFNDSIHHHISFNSTAVYNKTKDLKSFVWNNAVSFGINQKKVALYTGASWIYGTQNKQLSNNDFSASANIDYLKNVQRFYYWGLVNYDNSYSLKINYRFQSGAGVCFTFVKEKNLDLELSDGILFENSDLTDPVVGKDVYQTVRNSLRFKYRWSYNKTFSLEGTNFYQPSLGSFSDYIFRLDNKLTVQLNKWLAVNAALTYNKISRTNRENLLLTYGIIIDNYF